MRSAKKTSKALTAKLRRGNLHIFPLKGKIMEKVEICTSPGYHSISISFQDKHSLTFVINPGIKVQTQYEKWTSRLLKNRLLSLTSLPFV
jgi:hypothetical protein